MLANRPDDKSALKFGHQGQLLHATQPVLPTGAQGFEIPCPAVKPGVLLFFEMLLSSRVIDLHAITEVIRTDVGLTVHLLRLAAKERTGRAKGLVDIEDIVVLLGINRLKGLLEQATVLSGHPRGEAGVSTYDRFCMHARLTALIAEELASETATVRQEDAYIAGLLRHVGAIPFVLGWKIPELESVDTGEVGDYLARNWRLPDVLVDIIRGDREDCGSSSLALFDVVNTADNHAFRLEVGCDYPAIQE
ncbi:MAG: HDOD domain-containing protein [Acidobacteriia bacterium]|nr:HDOD domain-containing protein [Terriglobia bacterium]